MQLRVYEGKQPLDQFGLIAAFLRSVEEPYLSQLHIHDSPTIGLKEIPRTAAEPGILRLLVEHDESTTIFPAYSASEQRFAQGFMQRLLNWFGPTVKFFVNAWSGDEGNSGSVWRKAKSGALTTAGLETGFYSPLYKRIFGAGVILISNQRVGLIWFMETD